jgi:hypothetical protein
MFHSLNMLVIVLESDVGGDHRQPRAKRKADQRAPETRKLAPLI